MKKTALGLFAAVLLTACGNDSTHSKTATSSETAFDSAQTDETTITVEAFDAAPTPVFLKTISNVMQEGYYADSVWLAKKEKSKDTLYPHKFSWLRMDTLTLIDLTFAVYKPLDKTDSSSLNKAVKVVAWHYLKETGKKFYNLAEGMIEEWEFKSVEEAEQANEELNERGTRYYPVGAWMNTVHENKLYVVHSFNVMYFPEMSKVFEILKQNLKATKD